MPGDLSPWHVPINHVQSHRTTHDTVICSCRPLSMFYLDLQIRVLAPSLRMVSLRHTHMMLSSHHHAKESPSMTHLAEALRVP